MRIRGAKTELESAGEDTEGMADSTSKLRKEIEALSGVDIMLDSDTFKSTYQILDEISEVWDDLSDINQANIIEKIAGKNRGNIFTALMENWNQARKVVKTSANSIGSALKENDKYLESINGKIAQFTASFQALSSEVLDGGLVKGFFDLATFASDFATSVVDVVGVLPALSTLASSLLTMRGTDAGSRKVVIICPLMPITSIVA